MQGEKICGKNKIYRAERVKKPESIFALGAGLWFRGEPRGAARGEPHGEHSRQVKG